MSALSDTAGPLDDLILTLRQTGYELRSFSRNRTRLVFTLGFPLMFLVLFGAIGSGSHISQYGGLAYDQFIVPGLLAYAIMTTSFVNIAISTAMMRDSGVLKRMSGTPLPRAVFTLARIGATVVVVAAACVLTLVIGAVAYGVHVPTATLGAIVLSVLLGTATFTALGLAIVRLIPNADAAPAIVNLCVLPLSFISGIWFVPAGMPAILRHIAAVFPVQPLADALQHAFNPHTTGAGFSGTDLRTLAIWCAVGVFGMMRFMRSPGGRNA